MAGIGARERTQLKSEGFALLDVDVSGVAQQQMQVFYHPLTTSDGKPHPLAGQPTAPLPADPVSLYRYLRRGLTLEPPKKPDGFKCPECGRACKGAFGLQSHMRKHNKGEKE